jgi:phosphate transport system permease protein
MPAILAHPRLRPAVSLTMFIVCAVFSVTIVAVLGLVTWFLAARGWSAMSLDLFTRVPTEDLNDPGGLKHAILGTLQLLAMAGAVGVPAGVLAGVYLSEYCGSGAGVWARVGEAVRFVADVLAGVPSIVVGILGYELLVRPLGNFNGWAGAFALAFIMIPIVARTTEEMLRLVPDSYRAGSLALGATKSQTILRVVLPAATGPVVTGVMLAMARVAGETAPLLFTALGSRFVTLNPNEPFPSLTVQIYQYATGPYQAQKELAWAGILVLIVLLFVLNLAIRAITARSIRARVGGV